MLYHNLKYFYHMKSLKCHILICWTTNNIHSITSRNEEILHFKLKSIDNYGNGIKGYLWADDTANSAVESCNMQPSAIYQFQPASISSHTHCFDYSAVRTKQCHASIFIC